MRAEKVWFKWPNGQLQKVYIYEDFVVNGETYHRAKSNNKNFVLKDSDYGKTWAHAREELE